MYKLNLYYTQSDVIDYQIFFTIEAKINGVRNAIYNLGFTNIPSYTPTEWTKESYLLVDSLNNIENGIKNIGKYYFRPKGWIKGKNWVAKMSFSYKDVNRWIDNLNLVIDRINNESNELYPRDDLYPSDTLLPH